MSTEVRLDRQNDASIFMLFQSTVSLAVLNAYNDNQYLWVIYLSVLSGCSQTFLLLGNVLDVLIHLHI